LSDIFSNNFKNYPNEKAVASALVLGVRSDFSTELKNAYADTGATHVLSVSGLHVGLVAGLLGWILRRIKKKKTDKFSPKEIAILILFIWFYVLLTGASASVLRSGLMFSFVLLAGLVRRKMSIYNSLAASAFFLLCLDPKYLFDIGFQLSYLALFGIVFFHPYIYKLFYFKNKAANWAWNLTAVAIAAQVATLPVGLYYFHQFPSYFWLSGLAVIPLSTFALYSGIVLLIVDWIPYLGDLVALLCYFSLALMNACIFAIQRLPLSVIDGFWLGIGEMLLFYLIIFMVSAAFIYKSLKIGYLSFLLVFVLFCGQFWNLFQSSAQEKLFVYKINKSTLIEFADGHSSYLISDSTLAKNKIDFFTENNRTANKLMFGKSYKLGDSINVANLFIEKNRIGKFKEFSFAIPNNTSLELTRNREAPLKIDFLILSANPTIKNLEQLESLFDYRYLVFDASSSRYKIQQWIRQCKELSIPYVNCSEKGIDLLSFSQKSAN
jgi:competence protein ComEC